MNRPAPLSIAMLSVHSSPIGPLGTRDTGGMSVYVRQLARCLGRRGHQVDIFTAAGANGPAAPVPLDAGVRLIRLNMGTAVSVQAKEQLHSHLPAFLAELERFRLRAGRGYDLIHSHYWLSGQVGAWASQAWGVPHILTFHTLGAAKQSVPGQPVEPAVRLAVESELAQSCDRVLVTCERERCRLQPLCPPETQRLAVIPCGVDLGLFRLGLKTQARARLGLESSSPLALYVGRFAPEKGLERLLRALNSQPLPRGLTLLVVGGEGAGSEERQRMQALVAKLDGARRVLFAGRVEQRRLPDYYRVADVLVVPAYYESFGLVALEALACGTPVAATRVGIMEELLEHHGTGCLAADGSDAALLAAIEAALRLPGGDEPARRRRRRVAGRYGWARVAAAVERLYAQCCREARRRQIARIAQGDRARDLPCQSCLHDSSGREVAF